MRSASTADVLWTPSLQRQAASQCARFIEFVNHAEGTSISDYAALHEFSIRQPEKFWAHVWQFCDIKAERTWSQVLTDGDRMLDARWFLDSRLNFAANLLRYRDERTALVFISENGHRVQMSFAELYREVGRVAAGLANAGTEPGDRVVAYMPNRIETVVAMLAATSLGAVFSSCSMDFGINGVLERFAQIEPKVLFCCDGYFYNGKRIDRLPRLRHIAEHLPSLRQVVVVPYLDEQPPLLDVLPQAEHYSDFGQPGTHVPFESMPFDHPVYIMYSSGTTGPPKCIVHGAGGTLLQHLKELVLHVDLTRSDSIFYFTTCGWMMWNWLVTSLAVGAKVVLFDGSPMYPSVDVLWDIAETEEVSIFGTSARYLVTLEKSGAQPRRNHDLSRLRLILSTGSPLLPSNYDYVYRDIKADAQLASISGGTDILSCFALGTPLKPVYRGQLQCLGLGMNVAVFDDNGRALPPGTPGELVCTAPFPSMPVKFWNDPDGKRYHETYFSRFENTWCHGDWAELTPEGGLIIYGRSDATLNPGGVRIGTAEIYREVEKFPEVAESLVVGQEWQGDVRVVLFLRLHPDSTLDKELEERIRTHIRNNTSPRHVPAKIIQVPDIPRTLNGKTVELAVRDVIHDRPVKNVDALANPEALEHFRGLRQLAV
ncbi:MAG TPA: acetoacetate--CoA ligase [Hyphomicrobiaceae bacterium]